MTVANNTFPDVTADAILAEDRTNLMPVARAKSNKPADADRVNRDRLNYDRVIEGQCWDAVVARDSGHDGKFVFAVATTGVYCRPSCPARRPRRENVTFFSRPEQAEKAGFRACLRCRPRSVSGHAQSDSAKEICRYIEQHLDEPITLERLGKAFRQSPFHLQRRFKAALGITPREYADSCRLRQLKRNLQSGDNVTRAMYDAGYGSSSRLTRNRIATWNDARQISPRRHRCRYSLCLRRLAAGTHADCGD